jgi:hypothetical protein
MTITLKLNPELEALLKQGSPCSVTVHAAMGTDLSNFRTSLKEAGFNIRPDGKGLEIGEATIRSNRDHIVITLHGNSDDIRRALKIEGIELASAEKTTGYVSAARTGGV